MKKAIYTNQKTGKHYCIMQYEGETETKLVTVFDNEGVLNDLPYKVDKTGKAYRVCEVEEAQTKKGYKIMRTKKGS